MGFLRSVIGKIRVGFKKRFAYEEGAETVDIRLDSIPDWLYKITLKDTGDLLKTAQELHLKTSLIGKKFGVLADAFEINVVLDKSLSKYRLEVIEQNKKNYLDSLDSLRKVIEKKPQSLEGYRSYFEILQKDFVGIREELTKYAVKLSDFYKKDLLAISSELENLQDIFLKFSSSFNVSGDEKIKAIIKQVQDLHNTEDKIEDLEKEVSLVEAEIKRTKSHVYKLSDKVDRIKSSPRFKDVISRESRLGGLLQERDNLVTPLVKHFSHIEIILYMYAQKVREEDLSKDYCTHLREAISHDRSLSILEILAGLSLDLENKRTKIRKGLSDEEAEKFLGIIGWLRNNLKNVVEQTKNVEERIKAARLSLKNYVVVNELEDVESRVAFYQNKVRDLIFERKHLLKQIDSCHLLSQKEKLRKDLLIVTGYDVNVVYDSETEFLQSGDSND